MKKPYTINEVQGYDYVDPPNYWLQIPGKKDKVFLPVDFDPLCWPEKLNAGSETITELIMNFCRTHKVQLFVFANNDDASACITVVVGSDALTRTVLLDEMKKNNECFTGVMTVYASWKRFMIRPKKPDSLFQRGDEVCDCEDFEEEE